MPCISQATVIGDSRKYLSILLTIKTTTDDDGNPTMELSPQALEIAKSIGSTAKTISETQNCQKFKEYINKKIEEYNEKKAISNAQGYFL